MKTINPQELHELIKDKDHKVALIDVRTPEEYDIEHIEWSINMPVDYFQDHKDQLKEYDTIITYCNTSNSSSLFNKRAASLGIRNIYSLWWWLSWCKGQCNIIKKKSTLPLMQQVQIAAGFLVLFGIILSLLWHNYAIAISVFVWAGLIFAWSTWRCGMAKALAYMPRNRSSTAVDKVHGKNLVIKQFEDTNLAHYSYIAISQWEAIVVDPERDPTKYYEYAKQHNAKIVGVLNTHPHADFASWHLQIHQETQATIYVSDKVWAEYPHILANKDTSISFGSSKIQVYETPWHSPDSLSYMAVDKNNKEIWLFTGDWLFIGDVWRADLRENVGNIQAKQEELAAMMYDTTRSILPKLSKSTIILPAHWAGTSCGKWLSKKNMDTLENQRKYNPMLQEMSKESFIAELTSQQPAIPAYFTNSVLLNKKWNTDHHQALQMFNHIEKIPTTDEIKIIDTRTIEQYINYPVDTRAINIPHQNIQFITMIWTLVYPSERFVLIIQNTADIQKISNAIISIWYEKNVEWIYVIEENGIKKHSIHANEFKHSTDYSIINLTGEQQNTKNNNIYMSLEDLAKNVTTLDKDKTYIAYCWWTYKSWIAYSILSTHGYKTKKIA